MVDSHRPQCAHHFSLQLPSVPYGAAEESTFHTKLRNTTFMFCASVESAKGTHVMLVRWLIMLDWILVSV